MGGSGFKIFFGIFVYYGYFGRYDFKIKKSESHNALTHSKKAK